VSLSELVEEFIEYWQAERGLTPKSTKTMRAWCHHFVRWSKDNGAPDPKPLDFNLISLRKYLYHLHRTGGATGSGRRPRSVKSALPSLRTFGKYLEEFGFLKDNPASKLKTPKLDAAIRHTMSNEQMLGLLFACERQVNPRRVALSRALIHVLAFCGLIHPSTH
jgi:site-specific recombinase XerD